MDTKEIKRLRERKALAEAAAKPGQVKLTSLFDVQREAEPSTSTDSETAVTAFVEKGSQKQRNDIVHIQIPWEKCRRIYNRDKEKRERSGRYFSNVNGLKNMTG